MIRFTTFASGCAAALMIAGPALSTAQDTPGASAAAALKPDPTIMTVDGSPIRMSDVERIFNAQYAQRLQQIPPDQQQAVMGNIQKMILDQLITRTLLLNAATAQSLKTDQAELDGTLDKIAKSLPGGGTIEEFAVQAGVSVNEIKEQVSDDLRIKQLVDGVTEGVQPPTEEKVKAYYDENVEKFKKPETVKARHILVSTEGISDDAGLAEKKAKAESIRGELIAQEGKNFAEVAKEKSDGPSNVRGGDLGEFGRGQMVPEFDEAAFSQAVGAIGEPVKTNFGYHIIQVQERSEARQMGYDEVKEHISKGMHEEGKTEKFRGYVKELKDKAKIVQQGAEAPAPEPTPAPAAPGGAAPVQ